MTLGHILCLNASGDVWSIQGEVPIRPSFGQIRSVYVIPSLFATEQSVWEGSLGGRTREIGRKVQESAENCRLARVPKLGSSC